MSFTPQQAEQIQREFAGRTKMLDTHLGLTRSAYNRCRKLRRWGMAGLGDLTFERLQRMSSAQLQRILDEANAVIEREYVVQRV